MQARRSSETIIIGAPFLHIGRQQNTYSKCVHVLNAL